MLICVPTPLTTNNTPDLQYIHNTLHSIQKYLKKGQLLVLESTTYPGTTAEEIVPEVEKNKFKIGIDFFIAYSPEREDPGNPNYSTKTSADDQWFEQRLDHFNALNTDVWLQRYVSRYDYIIYWY